jgi:hypothetical protein
LVVEQPENKAVAESKGDPWPPEALGYLVFSGRRIPLQIKSQKTDKIK